MVNTIENKNDTPINNCDVSNFELSKEAKLEYLDSLIRKAYKILHLIEEEKETGFSPKSFIYGQLLEINAANMLFNGKLVNIIVKLKVIYDNYQDTQFSESKKQIFEIKKIINKLQKDLQGESVVDTEV